MSDTATTADGEADQGDTDGARPEELPPPPGPGGVPVLGNLLDLRDPRGFYEELSTHGDVVRYGVAGFTFTALLHPDHVERVLVTDSDAFGKWGFEEFGGEFASEGLLLSEGEQWRRQRVAIQNAFTPDRIQGYVEGMADAAERLVEGWDDGEEVALDEAFSRLTLEVLTRTLFDVDLADDGEIVTRFARTVTDRGDASNPTAWLPMWVPTPGNRRYKRTLGTFRGFVEGLIDERRGRADEYDDLLSLLLTAEDDDGEGMSETEVRDQMATFLFAGHETTSTALTYAFLELAKRDGVRERLDAEYGDVLGGGSPGVTDVPALEYTGRVIDETLRLYPPAHIMFREARRDVAFDGHRVPEGTKVTLPQFHVHTDERWYDDPDEFCPARWTENRRADRPDYAYFPFGGGPRHCIGMRFAMMELKTVVPTIAQQVDLEPLTDPDPEFGGATLRPSEDVVVRVRKR